MLLPKSLRACFVADICISNICNLIYFNLCIVLFHLLIYVYIIIYIICIYYFSIFSSSIRVYFTFDTFNEYVDINLYISGIF